MYVCWGRIQGAVYVPFLAPHATFLVVLALPSMVTQSCAFVVVPVFHESVELHFVDVPIVVHGLGAALRVAVAGGGGGGGNGGGGGGVGVELTVTWADTGVEVPPAPKQVRL